MPVTPAKSFRFSPELLERVDRYAEQLSADSGIPVSRNAAMAKLLSDALDAEDSRSGRSTRPSSRAPRR